MASEARIQTSLQIRRGALVYQSQPTSFNANVAGNKGPTPGAILVSTHGTDVSLAQLTNPGGLCRIMNLDPTHVVEYGIYDPVTFKFYPLGECLPAETYIIRLSRELGREYGTGSGTGTGANEVGSGDTFRFKADTADCMVLIEAFDA